MDINDLKEKNLYDFTFFCFRCKVIVGIFLKTNHK